MSSDSDPPSGPDLRAGIAAADLPEGAMLAGHVGDEAVLLTRQGGEIFAVGARCAHYGGPLAEGLVVGGAIRCPWHHAEFDLRTGAVRRPPACDGIPCWDVLEQRGRVTVAGRREPPPVPAAQGSAERPGIVIVGGGASGHYAAETLRRERFDGAVTIVEAGPDAPYDRPNLSKDYLAGTAEEAWIPLRPEPFYAEQGIELIRGTAAAALDPAARRLRLSDGSTREFAALLIATGAEPVRLPGEPGQRVYLLRTLADSRAIIAAAGSARRAVVIGASFIGLEVAASLRARGIEVTIVAPGARPLEKVLGPEIGDMVRALHEAHGVAFELGRTTTSIGRETVTLDDGRVLDADLVVAGIGVRPVTALAEAAKLTVDRGIVVDRFLETSAPGIYAAGDVARWPDPRSNELVRIEHWVLAQRQGQAAARNMLRDVAGRRSERQAFDAVPFFWSRHYDIAIDYSGYAPRWDDAVVSGDLAAHDATVSYVANGRVLAVATIGRDLDNLRTEAAMERGVIHAG